MSDITDLERVLRGLSAKASITTHAGVVVIRKYEDRQFESPIELKIDEASLARYLSETAEDAQAAFGVATPPRKAAAQLLLVHLEEMLLTRKGGQRTLVLKPEGLEWEA